jgi:site-specific DNA recombinase
MKTIALYARVSSEQQAERSTIESQVAALRELAVADGHTVLPGDVYTDEGFSGATLARPALERLRDRVAEGAIDIVYVHHPDRLARRYAYQVLLLEEFAAHGVAVVFLQRPSVNNPEDALLVQFQGIIAEYERTKIAERCRRGKLHMARRGALNPMSGAPYGYTYVRKSDTEPARYEILLPEAKIVRRIFDSLVREQKSIGEIVRMLNGEHVPTRRGASRWDRATVWGILANPAYRGEAAFGKTEAVERGRLLRPIRSKAMIARRIKSSYRDKPPEQWIHIPVPALVSPEIFDAAREQLTRNRHLSQRNARGERYLLQGLVVCARCRYAYYGKTVSKAAAKGGRQYAYYRCVGTDSYRFAGGRVCTNPQVRSDQLDDYVWESVRQVLEDPGRVAQEWARRAGADREHVEHRLQRDEAAAALASHERSLKRLIDAYEAGALYIEDLTSRTDRLKAKIKAARDDLRRAEQALAEVVTLRAVTCRLQDFAASVRQGLDRLSWHERRQLIRTLVARVEIDEEGATIVFRLPPPAPPPPANEPSTERGGDASVRPPAGMHQRERSHHAALRCARDHARDHAVFHHPGFEPLPQQLEHPPIRDALRHELEQLLVVDAAEVVAEVGVEHVMASLRTQLAQGLQRHRRAPLRPEAVRARKEIRLEDRLQQKLRRHLDHPVSYRRDAQRPLLSIGLRNVPAPHHTGPIRACAQLRAELFEEALDAVLLDVADRLAVDARGALVSPHSLPRFEEDVTPPHVVVQRVEAPLRGSLGCCPQPALQLLHVVARLPAAGVVRSGPARHSLARTCFADMTTAGTLPSRRVVRRGVRSRGARCMRLALRYYDPLGLPLHSGQLRLRLIRLASP